MLVVSSNEYDVIDSLRSNLTASYTAVLSQPVNYNKFTYLERQLNKHLIMLFFVNSNLHLPVNSLSMKIVLGNIEVGHGASAQRALTHPCMAKHKEYLDQPLL